MHRARENREIKLFVEAAGRLFEWLWASFFMGEKEYLSIGSDKGLKTLAH